MDSRQLDILIAEKLLGAKVTHLNQKAGWRTDYVADKYECNNPIMTDWGNDGYRLKHYSTDIKDCWAIVKYMRCSGSVFTYKEEMIPGPVGCEGYMAKFEVFGYGEDAPRGDYYSIVSECDAICRAALRTIGVDNG